MSDETVGTLRAAIEAALQRRYTNTRGVSVVDGPTSISTQRAGAVIDEAGIIREVCVLTHISANALGALAVLLGLRDDGSDPAEEVERLRASMIKAAERLGEEFDRNDCIDEDTIVCMLGTGIDEAEGREERLKSEVDRLRAEMERMRDEAADAWAKARAREAYAIDLADLRDTLRRSDDLRVWWRERVADVANERDALRADNARVTTEREAALDALYEYAPRCRNCGCISTRVGGDYVALCDSDACARGVPDVHDVTHSDALRAANPLRGDATRGALDDLARVRAELDAAREVIRADLHCDECHAVVTRCHAETASFCCDEHGVGEGWADTTHAAAVRAAVKR